MEPLELPCGALVARPGAAAADTLVFRGGC